MPESHLRKLVAILAADIAGYSAPMGSDEARTVRDLKGNQTVVLPMIREFGGRIIDTAGDGLLAEFASVVGAVDCAVAIQGKMAERNATIEPERRMRECGGRIIDTAGDGLLAEFASVVGAVDCAVAIQGKMAERNATIEPERRMKFRIGVNFGDVIYDEAHIYGEDINIAARLGGIAEPGGILISRQVFDQVHDKVTHNFRNSGQKNLKNISKPVEVFEVDGVRGTDTALRKLVAILAADIAGYSALMGSDEARTVRDLKGNQTVVLPMIREFGGRIIDTAGDGLLAEFASVVGAVDCAVAIQGKMAERNATIEPERRMKFRMGVNIGDVIYDEARIYGEDINIAARLEGIAEPGGILISRQVFDQVHDKVTHNFRNLGQKYLKNISKPVEVFEVDRVRGTDTAPGYKLATLLQQEIKYCLAHDGVRLAYATAGAGPALVKSANWMNHLEYDWESPVWRHLVRGLAKDYTLIRYDARGNGMSDWDCGEVSLDAWVSDLETVVDAVGIKRFPLLGLSQGCAVSIAYAARHPERVSYLVLYGGFALGGKKRSQGEKEKRDAMTALMRLGWGFDNPAFRQMFTALFIPGGTKEQVDYFDELQRRSTSPEYAARYFDVCGDLDVDPSTRQSDCADARDACARRFNGSVRTRSPDGCWNSWRQIHRTPGSEPSLHGA